MTKLPPLPENLSRQAGFLTAHEQQKLWEAALLMSESRGLLVRLVTVFGRQVEGVRNAISGVAGRLAGNVWTKLETKLRDSLEEILWRSYSYATFGLESAPDFLRPRQPRKNRLHQAATTVSGVASGFVGLPGVMVDLPFTTATILRSIAEIARDYGEDLSSDETRRACLEVLTFGGPGETGAQTEAGYWAARLGMSHMTTGLLIRSAAGQLSLVLSEKILAQTVPVAGAVACGLLNYNFTDYYQSMAKVHFCLRALERRTGDPEGVARCFNAMLEAARDRRKLGRTRRRVAPALLTGTWPPAA